MTRVFNADVKGKYFNAYIKVTAADGVCALMKISFDVLLLLRNERAFI